MSVLNDDMDSGKECRNHFTHLAGRAISLLW